MGSLLFGDGSIGFAVALAILRLLGAGAAIAAGRAIAGTWRPIWQAAAYMVPLTAAMRFLLYAMLGEPLFAPVPAALTFVYLVVFALLGYRGLRAGQMARQYSWVYHKTGPLGWRARA